MQTRCAWCGGIIADFNQENPDRPISHGICLECVRRMFIAMVEPIENFLNRFKVPVMVINNEERVVALNLKGLDMAGHIKSDARLRCGDAIECINASKPEGCGRTVHCRACTIRNSVLHTYSTGQPLKNIPAYPDLQSFDTFKQNNFLISTEKVGELVILKIEENCDHRDSE